MQPFSFAFFYTFHNFCCCCYKVAMKSYTRVLRICLTSFILYFVRWEMSYLTPPTDCHRPNAVMRSYLSKNGLEQIDIDDICYVNKDKW